MFYSWNRAHFGAWVITSSPLILGMCKLATLYMYPWVTLTPLNRLSADPSDEKLEPFLHVIGNAEALAINQIWFGHPGRIIEEAPQPGSAPLNKLQLWMKPQGPSACAIFVLNYAAAAAKHSIDFSKLKFNGTAVLGGKKVTVRDVWQRQTLPPATGSMEVSVPAYDSALLLLTAQ